MKIAVAAVQMRSDLLDVPANLRRADDLLRAAHDSGVELAVLPELFNTGYSLCPDYGPYSETAEGPTLSHLRQRSRQWRMGIAAGFVERDGAASLRFAGFCSPDGEIQIYRKRNLVFWERFRFHPGRAPLVVSTPWGRVGFAICADMIYRKVWNDYRGSDRPGRGLGGLARLRRSRFGPPALAAWATSVRSRARFRRRSRWISASRSIFANQCGETHTTIPVLGTRIRDRFAGQSSICDGRHGEPVRAGREPSLLIAPITLHQQRGLKSWRSMSPSAPAASCSESALS